VVDHELGGKRLEAGQRVFAMINAANRDASQFDRAESFDIERTPNRHLTFGQGIHFCMGASLARLEGRIALDTLIRRFPSLGLVDSDPPEWTNAMIMRGLRRLPVS
jgi:cytochrome P450